MQIKLNNNTFLRNINGYAYLINQRTKKEKIFDESSFLFLSKIEREFKNSESILLDILRNFEKSDHEIIRNDFFEFINELVSENFIELKQESINTVSQNDIILNPKIEEIKQTDIKETSELLYEILLHKPFLFSLQIELLSHCNEQCIHCYIPKDNKSTLDFEKVINILDQAKSMGVLSISFTGGEPFLFKNFHSVLRKARDNDFIITILTNLTLINQKDIDVLKELNIYNIQVSVYSMVPEIHDSITKLKGSFHKTINNVESLINEGIPIEVSCPIIKENRYCYNDVLDWCNSKGIKVYTDFNITAITNFTKSNLKHRLNNEELKQTLSSILLHDKKYNIFSKREMQSIKPNQPVKISAFKSIAVSSKGCYVPDVGWDDFILGDVNKDTLESIWAHSEKLNLLRTLNYKYYTKCLNCSASGYCTLCLSWNYYENGGNLFNIPKTYCKKIFIIKKMIEKHKNKDSFLIFMKQFNIDENKIIEFGLNESIFIKPNDASNQWQTLKATILSNKDVFVRSFGRVKIKQEKLLDFYKEVLKLDHVHWDTTNNTEPAKIITNILKLKKNKDIINYKVAHVWGKTINPFAFCAAWNIVYVPTIIDPLTGHESKGELSIKFKNEFQLKVFNLYKKEIEDFNDIMEKLAPAVKNYVSNIKNIDGVSQRHLSEFKEHILQCFNPIKV